MNLLLYSVFLLFCIGLTNQSQSILSSVTLPYEIRIRKPWLSVKGPINNMDFKIIGGQPVKVGGAPYQVALFRSGSFICGGSLIASDKVLTAAHCVYGHESTPTRFKVRYATLYRNSGSDLTVTKIIRHPDYSSKTIDYDVAILCLASDFTPGVNAAIIPLTDQSPSVGSGVVVTGWGSNSQSNTNLLPLYLQQASNLTILSQEDCTNRWGVDTITDRMLCAFSTFQSACNGDSGGPIVQNGILVGVVSWASSWCLHPTHPNVYANVSNLRKWIVNATISPGSNGSAGSAELFIPLIVTSVLCQYFFSRHFY